MLGSMGPLELGIIAFIALLLFGSSRIAGIGKGLGESIRNFHSHVHRFRAAGEADEVAEQHRDDLALLTRRRRHVHGRAACQAEASDVGVVLAAGGARWHAGQSTVATPRRLRRAASGPARP